MGPLKNNKYKHMKQNLKNEIAAQGFDVVSFFSSFQVIVFIISVLQV